MDNRQRQAIIAKLMYRTKTMNGLLNSNRVDQQLIEVIKLWEAFGIDLDYKSLNPWHKELKLDLDRYFAMTSTELMAELLGDTNEQRKEES